MLEYHQQVAENIHKYASKKPARAKNAKVAWRQQQKSTKNKAAPNKIRQFIKGNKFFAGMEITNGNILNRIAFDFSEESGKYR